MPRGHVKKREWLDGITLPAEPAKRADRERAIRSAARAEGRKLGKVRPTYQARIPSPRNPNKDVVKTFDRKLPLRAGARPGERPRAGRGRLVAPRWTRSVGCRRKRTRSARGRSSTPAAGGRRSPPSRRSGARRGGDFAPKTQVGYESILRRHVLPAFGSAHVASITPKDIQDFANRLAADLAPNTVRRIMDVVRGVLALAAKRRYITASPAVGVELEPKGDGIEINPLTHGEVRALVAALPERWRLPVLLDVYTGLRAGELWALRRRDVDALRGELLVDEALKEVTSAAAANVPEALRVTPSLILGPTKTYAKRKVSVPAFLRDELAAHLSRPLPGGDGRDAFIFTTPTGEPVRHNLFYKRIFAPTVAATFAGRALRFHDLRHTCAAWLIEAGAHPLQIKLRLGHKEIRTTMDTYGHLFPSAEPAMADLLDAGYRSADTPAGLTAGVGRHC